MRRSHFTSICIVLFLMLGCLGYLGCLGNKLQAAEYVYLSAGGKVTVFEFNDQTSALKQLQAVDMPGAGPMTFSSDLNYLYVAGRIQSNQGKGRKRGLAAIASFAIADNGRLKLLHRDVAGEYPSYLVLDKTDRFLYGSHYGPGAVSAWAIKDGVYRKVSASDHVTYKLEPKAHATLVSPDNKFLYVPATGPNKVFQFHLDASTGKLTPLQSPFASGPELGAAKAGTYAREPRHMVFHPSLPIAYTTLEREQPGVGVWDWDRTSGQLNIRQHLISLPEGFKGRLTTADLHLSPDHRYLYISNRHLDKKPAKEMSSIVQYKVNAETGELTFVKYTPCPKVPRSFGLSQKGTHVFVAGQGDDKLGIYSRDAKTGHLNEIKRLSTGSRPTWVQSIVK